MELEVTHDDSDHNPVIIRLGPITPEPDFTISKKTNWIEYTKFLTENISNIPLINSAEEIEDYVVRLEEDINAAINHSTKQMNRAIQNTNGIPPQIKELIRQKRRARKRAQLTRSPNDNAIYNHILQKSKS